MNPNLIKLIVILTSAFTILIVGFIVQRKHIAKKQKELDMMNSQYSSNSEILSEEEKVAKNYIESYKSSFSRDSIKQALLQSGNSSENIETWLNKYF